MTTPITTVAGKGAPLNTTEFDANFTELRDAADAALAALVPATLLTTILGIDGAGSGVDADLLDGQHAAAFAPAINSDSSALGADTAIGTANTWTDAVSLSLGAGTWLIMASIHISCDGGADRQHSGRLYDSTGAAELASGAQKNGVATPSHSSISLSAVVTLSGTSTIKLQGASSSNSNAYIESTDSHMAGTKATQIVAIQIA